MESRSMERRRVWLERWVREWEGEEEMGREWLRYWRWRRIRGMRRMERRRKTKDEHVGKKDC